MKVILISLLLVTPMLAASQTFEIDSEGCMFNESRATCVVTNKLEWDVKCNLTTSAITKNETTISKSSDIVIHAKSYQIVKVQNTKQNPILDLTVFGVCSVIQ